MKNLFKAAALGLALTAGLTSCGEKKTEESTTVETPAAGGEAQTTTVADSTVMAAPSTTDAAAPAVDAAAPAVDAAAPTTTTTTTEEKK